MLRCLPFLVILLVTIPGSAGAFRRHSLSIGDGMSSAEQWRNVLGDHTEGYARQGIPLVFSGSAFITYRYTLDERLAVGIAAGLDNSGGLVRPGRGHYSSLLPGTLGAYHRRSRTIAAELRVVYYSDEENIFYGLLGLGYTSSNVSVDYVEEAYNEIAQYRPGVLGDDPRVINDNRFAHHVTVFGYRTNTRLGLFAETGFGYKGLVHFGVSYDF